MTKGCMDAERDALLAFKAGIDDPSHRLSSWRRRVDCCRWSGVVCDDSTGYVVQLNLQNAGNMTFESVEAALRGEISPSLLSLTHLDRLDLNHNDFEGSRIPAFLGSFPKLRYLDLSWSNFSGAIPPQLGNLSSLRYLDLRSYDLTTDGLDWLSRLSSLRYLDMSGVNLSTASHNWIHAVNRLPSLQQLYLSSGCGLTTLPTALSHVNLTALADLELRDNLFNSTFPNWLFELPRLSYLAISNSELHGTIPAGFGNLTRLTRLDLTGNSLAGSIPADIWSLTSLTLLDLSHNLFTSRLLPQIGNMTRFLTDLSLSGNSLTGQIPIEIGNLFNLTNLDLSHNLLSGLIPPEISKLSNLITLDLSSSYLEGTVSERHFANVTKLIVLCLYDNPLAMQFHHNWVPPFQLQTVKLDAIKLGPTFPTWIWICPTRVSKTRNLEFLHLNNNSLSGRIPPSLRYCNRLAIIDLGDNKFSGNVPTWIGQSLQNLEVLRLRSNMLSGNIPMQLGQLRDLQIIDLSNNRLSGSVPHSFGNFSAMISISKSMSSTISNNVEFVLSSFVASESLSLVTKGDEFSFSTILNLVKSIDLSDNELSGVIPTEIGSLFALQTLNLSRNSFGSTIPAAVGRMKSLETLDLSFNELSGVIPESFSALDSLSHLNLSYNNLSGVIPSGNQLRTLDDASIYIDNAYLCGPPVTESCYTMHSPKSIMAPCTRSTHPVPRHYSFGLWLTSILLFTSATTPTTKGCVEGERDALLDFKTGIVKDPSSRLSSWRGRVDCCRWSGVVCDNRTGHVVELNLQNSDPYNYETSIGGEIRPSLLLLTHLERLNLSYNDFGGIQIPKFLGSLTELTYLDLSTSNFSGAIPPQLGNLSRLRYLDLNSLYDLTIDGLHWLSRLTSLRYLDMSLMKLSMSSHNWLQAVNMLSSLEELHLQDCGLTNLHSSLSHVNLTTLATLDLHGNLFNSTFPNWLWKLHNLSYLDLSSSMLHGAISAGIGKLTGLRELHLSDNSLSGPVPTEIGICNSLKLIDLRDNSLFGPIPAGIGNLTAQCMSSVHLELHLSDNSLSGPVPTEIGNLNSLQLINLTNNLLSGSLPTEIGKLSNLNILSLSSNSLEGTVSELHFARLTKLSELDLSENSLVISVDYNWVPPFQLRSIQLKSCKLGPAFPRWLRSQNSIEDLGMSNTSIEDVLPDWFWNNSASSINLSQNQINGTLPTSLQDMTNLAILKLSMNLLEGPIPRLPTYLRYLYLYNNSFSGSLSSISLPLELELLDLSHNHINGSMPSFICNLTQLRILDLSSNQISGEIPWCWQETNFLFYINLAENKLSGEIPSSIEKLTQLRSLHLNNNSLHGHLPLSLKHCSGLVFLDLGDNKFSGSIPTWIAQNFQNLEVLRLCSNMFFGNIPSELGQLHHLHVIDLANNNLSGPIPRSFGNLNATKTYRQRKLTSITYRALASGRPILSHFDGTYDDSITLTIKGKSLIFSIIVYLVNIIDFSNNNLTGEIPVEIGSLSALQTLNLSRNNFVGQIPATISAMKSLETLDLSFNKFSGGIPQSLSDLYSLNHLNLSYNNLSGVIPSGNQLQTLNDSSIYIGNAYLCGAPLTKSCYDLKSNNVTKEDNKDGSFMPSYYLSIILGYLVGLWSVYIIILFKKNWRVFYFQMFDKIYDRAYV
ncbi:unnamed protein product, partial [Musa hybrid cultivar]